MGLHEELLLRIIVGTVLAGVIGYERDLHHRTAGFRTHLIVGMASSTFMTVSTHFVYFQHYHAGDLVDVDPSRIAAAVVTGIGFLAGGAILHQGVSVQGLTTAAGLWLVTAIGLSSGAGMYPESLMATLFGVTALALLRRFEFNKRQEWLIRRIQVAFVGETPPMADLKHELHEMGITVTRSQVDENRVKKKSSVTLDVRCAQGADEKLVGFLEQRSGIRRFRIQALE